MTELGTVSTPEVDIAVRTRQRRLVRYVALGLACAVLAAIAVVGVRWVYGPQSLRAYGGMSESAEGKPGRTVLFGAMGSQSANGVDRWLRVDLRSVRPIVSVNTAGADVRVLLCTIGTDGGIGISSSAHPYCSAIKAFQPGRVTLGWLHGRTDLLVAVTPRHVGTVRVDGLRVTYRDGVRRGDQHTGFSVTVTTRPAD